LITKPGALALGVLARRPLGVLNALIQGNFITQVGGQLGHAERNKVRAAYNRAQYLAERRRMMQAWADYLDSLRSEGRKAVPLRS